MNWKKVFQLALVHVGVSITVVPVTSTLNRIMIAELGFPAALVGLLVALPYLLSPLQVAIGSWSDRRRIWGRYRSPWIVLGGLMASFGGYFTAHSAYLMADHLALGLLAAVITFTVWGVGVNIASVSYLSLVSELSTGRDQWRSRAVSVMWSAMIAGFIVTAIGLSVMLEPYSEQALYTAFGVVWMAASFLVLIGAANLEPATGADRVLADRAPNAWQSMAALAGNRTAVRFFIYLLLVLISIHAQDVLLEPYGGEVLGMPVALTSRLTAVWGIGFFLTLIGGLPIVRRIGQKPSANIGSVIAAGGFALIIAAGFTRSTSIFQLGVFIYGLGSGILTLGSLSFMLEMTVPEAAGLYIGAWGVANFAGQAIANIVSGLLRDAMYFVTGSSLYGYALVFGIEMVGLLLAVWLIGSITLDRFRTEARVKLADVLILAGDN